MELRHKFSIANLQEKRFPDLIFIPKEDQFLWHTIGFNLDMLGVIFPSHFFMHLIVFTITLEGRKAKKWEEI